MPVTQSHSDRYGREHLFAWSFHPPFLAGFVAGEGHFRISPNNGGQSWCCGFDLRQREDNADLVAAARDLAGCGRLRWVPPRGTSHPQLSWFVENMGGCIDLADSLGKVDLLGKKAGDFAIWRTAVAIWSDRTRGASRWPVMERLALRLRAHRKHSCVPDYTRVDITQPALSGFLAGFASAEGHFGASASGHPRFVIKLREDDTAVLSLLADRFAVGRLVAMPESLGARAQTAWLVTRLDDLRSLIPVFDRHPPLGRAARAYAVWRELVMTPDRRATVLKPLAEQVREVRRYRAQKAIPTSPLPRASKTATYLAILASWAREAGPPYTATSYERWRSGRSMTPDRNTLARFFGSWRDALTAAGLPSTDARSRDTNVRSVETAAAVRAVIASHRRAAVLHAVEACWTELGRVPVASEFFRWRLQHARDSPSQPDIYRLFPGGWAAVLEALPPRGLT